MLKRTITGIVLVAIVIALLFLGEIALGITLAAFAVIGTLELYNAAKKGGCAPVKWVAFLYAIPILLYTINSDYNYFSVCVYVIATVVFFICIIKHEKHNIVDAVLTIFSGVIVSNMLYCIIAVYKTGESKLDSALILGLILIGACITDIFAYLFGVTLGKHKLCPSISPKKSIEGSIGGMLGVTICMSAYGYFVLNERISSFSGTPIYIYVILGLVCGIVSQVGDLSASMVKRFFGIKDYGKIFPGHGGILDRFDSFVFVTPVVYFFTSSVIHMFK